MTYNRAWKLLESNNKVYHLIAKMKGDELKPFDRGAPRIQLSGEYKCGRKYKRDKVEKKAVIDALKGGG